MSPALPVTVLVGASLMWGVMWWPLKSLHALGIEGLPLTFVAYAASCVMMLPILIAQRHRWRGQHGGLLAIAALGGYAALTFNVAMVYGEVVRVMVLFYLLPVWGVLGGRIFLGERIDAARWLGVVLALTGAFLILGGLQALDGSLSWPDILAVTCGMAYAGNNLVFRARQNLPVPSKLAAMQLGCVVIVAPLILLGLQPWPEVGAQSWLWVVVYGAGWLLLATAGTQWAVTHMEAGRASIIIILELVTAVVTAVLIGGESMDRPELIGGSLILAAAIVEARRPEPSQAV
jgi:drug/metabolite transporter (DMT)-like permease